MPAGIDAFVAGYGTGGTLVGCGRAIKRVHPKARIIAMEPGEATMLCGEAPCCHSIEGIAGGFVPPLLRTGKLDGEIAIKSGEAMAMTRWLAAKARLSYPESAAANSRPDQKPEGSR